LSYDLTLDAVENSGLDLDVIAGTGTIARGGWVDNIDGDPAQALANIFAAVNALVEPGELFPGTALPYRRLQVRPFNGDSTSIILYYTKEGAGDASAYIISSRSYLATTVTDHILATGEALRIQWKDTADNNRLVVDRPIRDSTPVVMREVTVNGVTIGTPDFEKYEGKVGYVNAEQWRSRDPGYWLLSDGGVDASRYAGTYGWHLSALTRNYKDWSEIRLAEHPQTQQFLPVKQSDLQSAIGAAYKQGVISQVSGLTRWGQFPTTSFMGIFGWGGAGGHQLPQTGGPIAPPDSSGVRSNT
jgi:hypothetical protein